MRDDDRMIEIPHNNAARGLVNGLILALAIWAAIGGFVYAWINAT
jgi:hypothetical protein